MVAKDEDALICDFAETYHIHHWRGLPVQHAAVLACGLPEDARIRRAMSGRTVPTQTLLMAAIVDRLSLLVWAQSEDGRRGINRPNSLVEAMTAPLHTEDVQGFSSAEAFERERERILKGVT